MQAWQSILVPFDGSSSSLAALDYAVELAEDYGARVEVLHVVQESDRLSRAAREEMERARIRALDEIADMLPGRLFQRTTAGEPVREILRAAHDDIDLVVIGIEGWNGRLHEMLGSVTEAVVRNSPCPVLTVRAPGTRRESFADRRHHRPELFDTGRF